MRSIRERPSNSDISETKLWAFERENGKWKLGGRSNVPFSFHAGTSHHYALAPNSHHFLVVLLNVFVSRRVAVVRVFSGTSVILLGVNNGEGSFGCPVRVPQVPIPCLSLSFRSPITHSVGQWSI